MVYNILMVCMVQKTVLHGSATRSCDGHFYPSARGGYKIEIQVISGQVIDNHRRFSSCCTAALMDCQKISF